MRVIVELGIIFFMTFLFQSSQAEALQTEAAKKLSNQARR